MGIYERATATDGMKIPVHTLGSLLRIQLTDVASKGVWAQNQIVTQFAPDAEYLTELASIATTYAGLLTDAAKSDYLHSIESALVLAEAGVAAEQDVIDVLGL